jgi:AAA+ ATPase superfamily predicted ATPase
VRPILAKPGSKALKYYIDDNFIGFWFRFIHKNRAALEIGNYKFARQVAERDFESFSGPYLEKYFREKLALSGNWSEIGRYWEKGNLSEIDIVAVNEMDKIIMFAEVKRNKSKINIDLLQSKAKALLPAFNGYEVAFKTFSLDDI